MNYVATVSKEELVEDSSAKLWAVIFYLAKNREKQLDEQFKALWLPYIYDAEVLNGGHLQYFVNQGTSNAEETIQALREIGAGEYANILEECYSEVIEKDLPEIQSLEQYSELALTESFPQDSKYYSVRPELFELLEQHFADQVDEWVAVDA